MLQMKALILIPKLISCPIMYYVCSCICMCVSFPHVFVCVHMSTQVCMSTPLHPPTPPTSPLVHLSFLEIPFPLRQQAFSCHQSVHIQLSVPTSTTLHHYTSNNTTHTPPHPSPSHPTSPHPAQRSTPAPLSCHLPCSPLTLHLPPSPLICP